MEVDIGSYPSLSHDVNTSIDIMNTVIIPIVFDFPIVLFYLIVSFIVSLMKSVKSIEQTDFD